MIALTITGADNEDCNDTFYGCYDFTTNKWQVEIPDGCCVEYSNACEYCDPNKTPEHITVIIAGVETCNGICYGTIDSNHKFTNIDGMNGPHFLSRTSYCNWYSDEGEVTVHRTNYYGDVNCGCITFKDEQDIGPRTRSVSVSKNGSQVTVYAVYGYCPIFLGTGTVMSNCLGATVNNEHTSCPCGTWGGTTGHAKGGTATIIEG
jgi:hypothetical protein